MAWISYCCLFQYYNFGCVLYQREEQISFVMAKVQELGSACKHQDQAKVVTLLKQTRKELRRELKKICAAVEEMKR